IITIVVVVVLIALAICVLVIFRNKKKKNTVVMPTQPQPVVTPVSPAPNPQPQQPKPQPVPVPPVTPLTHPTSQLTPISTKPITAFAVDKDEWIVVGASVVGNGHISTNLPCQDSHKYEYLGESWGIAVTSDGAGSAQNSHIGSKIVAERAVFHFKDLITRRNWIKKNELPTETEWSQICFATLKRVRNDMEMFAKQKNIELKSLYATAIVVIHTPDGILATHIGDGRAGYKNEKGEWKALIIPHKGEEANQTIFVPSDFWDIPAYKMSGVLVPESVVVTEKPFAFTLMSDGCENTAWLYNQQNETTSKFFDPNKPFPNFFKPLCDTLQSFRNDKVDEKERAEKWGNFIESGNPSFIKETDDKTMILGVVYM
ncbi:MAG: protein phosphatase 2C domain-containing protein, partial [Prevotellaceae bacterium]|nr:protein phosphatase 2C domain-containing protein [Prevotellaceae bacterium]